jgi:choline dehydrogenase-like flavoprotein
MPLERTSDTPPVVLIGLDAVEIDVVDRLVADPQLFDQAVRQVGLGHLERGFPDTPAGWRQALEAGKHHMGTTRMHVESRSGVVDENSRVHGTSNLYVTGSSVFPSGGTRILR